MYPEIESFKSWLTCQYPTSSTRTHYTSDLVLFFAWAQKSPAEISVQDIDLFVAYCQQKGHAATTINRRLTALNTFYYFLAMIEDDPPVCPVVSRADISCEKGILFPAICARAMSKPSLPALKISVTRPFFA